jgi:DNA-binding NarL/FixJ family response regulator
MVVIEGIQALLQGEKEIKIVGIATNGASCQSYLANQIADVVLMDINLPDISGIDLCKQIKDARKETMVLALSTFDKGIYMSKFMENGGSGYLLKNISKQELIDAIITVNKGGVYFSFEAGKIYKATLEKGSKLAVLTKRENEIVKYIADGFTNLQISQHLFISIDTVDTHRKNLYTKLNVTNTASLIRYAIENNLVSY